MKLSEKKLPVSKLKVEASCLRRSLTNPCNEFEAFVSAPEVTKNLNIMYNKLIDKAEGLFKVNMNLSHFMDSDELSQRSSCS